MAGVLRATLRNMACTSSTSGPSACSRVSNSLCSITRCSNESRSRGRDAAVRAAKVRSASSSDACSEVIWSLKLRVAFLLSSSALARFSNSSKSRFTSSISRRNRRSWGSAGSPSCNNFSASSFRALRMAFRCSWPIARNWARSQLLTTLIVAKIMFCLIRSCFFCQRAMERSNCLFSLSTASNASLSGGGMRKHTPGAEVSTPDELETRHFTRPELSCKMHCSPFSIIIFICL